MTDVKKETEVKETVSKEVEPKKSKTGKTVLIVLLVIVLLITLCGVGGFFVFRNWVGESLEEIEKIMDEEVDYVDEVADIDTTPTEEEDETEWFVDDTEDEDRSDDPRVDGELTNESVISDRFPDDIPLSGGNVTSSSFDQWSVVVEIATSSTAEEAYLYYEQLLEDTDWVVTSKSRDDSSGSFSFDNGKDRNDDDYRRGEISIRSWDWRDFTDITIRERY